MPRRPRYYIPGVPCHVIQRGNNRQPCFFRPQDYRQYLQWLTEASLEHGCAVHAYVLMTNHVHLLMTPATEAGISRLMQSLGRRYVQFINLVQARTGTLWEGRHRACLVESERYLLACHRYIEMNPVRAGMVQRPADYAWSSHRANALGRFDPVLQPHAMYEGLGNEPAARQREYRHLFRDDLNEAGLRFIRDSANCGVPLGSQCFRDDVDRMVPSPISYRVVGRPLSRKSTPTPFRGKSTPTPFQRRDSRDSQRR